MRSQQSPSVGEFPFFLSLRDQRAFQNFGICYSTAVPSSVTLENHSLERLWGRPLQLENKPSSSPPTHSPPICSSETCCFFSVTKPVVSLTQRQPFHLPNQVPPASFASFLSDFPALLLWARGKPRTILGSSPETSTAGKQRVFGEGDGRTACEPASVLPNLQHLNPEGPF